MKKALFVASILVLPLMVFALGVPTDFVVNFDGTTIATSWTAVPDATKYSVNIVAEYDLDEDGVLDLSVDYDFGTSDRTDGALMSDPNLNIPYDALLYDVDGDGVGDIAPGMAAARVKALNPGKGNGRQNNEFYSPFVPFIPIP
jgi:hypothetical protein